MWDLRLMGLVLRRTPVSEMSARVLPWAVAGFIVMLISGSLLVYQEPLRAYDNPFFRAKAVMLILAGVNVFVFHRTIGREFLSGMWTRSRLESEAGWRRFLEPMGDDHRLRTIDRLQLV